jgi:hypothetical protein
MVVSRRLRSVLPVAVVVAVLAGPALAAHAYGSSWAVIASPNRSTDLNDLAAVTAPAATDVWAVGWFRNGSSQYRTLTEHFDGASWRAVRSPNVGDSTNLLNGVDAVSGSDVWAVGQRTQGGSTSRTLTMHWGGSRWRVLASPNRGSANNVLGGVAAIAPNDVWAVGSARPSQFTPLAEHFDGTAWSVVPVPDPGDGLLNAVAAVSPTDVWAVGAIFDQAALVEHWNGQSWSIVPTPNTIFEESLEAVAAVSASDVWAVGHAGSKTLVEHWNGQSWSIVPSPNPLPSNGNNILNGVVALSATNVWAVGTSHDFLQGGLDQTVTEHWNGSAWSIVVSPNVGTGSNALRGVTTDGSSGLIAVGSSQHSIGAVDRTLVLARAG